MADLTLKTALADPKIRPLVLAWAERTYILDEVQFIVDMLQKREARQIYRDYIALNAPRAINLGGGDLKPARDLVARGSFKPTELRTALVTLTEKQFKWINDGTFKSGNNAFAKSPEYVAYQTATVTQDPKVAAALGVLLLPAAKAKQIEPFIETYLKARTPTDAYQAYVAMQKIVAKGKLDPALTAAGKPTAEVVRQHEAAEKAAESQRLVAANAQKAAKLVPTIKKELVETGRYLTSAIDAVKKKGKSSNPIETTRMFSSGRARMEKVSEPYVQAVRLDQKFASHFPTVAADKKKVDEQWADYRKLLGK